MNKTVLIVEDNKLNMKLFQDLMEAHDINTVETYHGGNVMELVRENMPDLILMDIQLPEIDGSELIMMIKAEEELKHIPIIAVTAFAMRGDEQKIRASGCEEYISKPISIPHFMEKVKYYLTEYSYSKDPETDSNLAASAS